MADQVMTQDSGDSVLVTDEFADMPIIDLEVYLQARDAMMSGQSLSDEAFDEC